MIFRMSVALLAMALLLSGEADRWPQFRGPAGTGIAESPVPVEFGPKQNLIWAAAVPLGHSSPSIWALISFLPVLTTVPRSWRCWLTIGKTAGSGGGRRSPQKGSRRCTK